MYGNVCFVIASPRRATPQSDSVMKPNYCDIITNLGYFPLCGIRRVAVHGDCQSMARLRRARGHGLFYTPLG